MFQVKQNNIPEVFDFASQLGFEKVSFLLVSSKAGIHGLVLVGSYDGHTLNQKSIQPYISLVQLASTILQQTVVDESGRKNYQQHRIPDCNHLCNKNTLGYNSLLCGIARTNKTLNW